MTIVIRNPRGDTPPAAPTRPDGRRYQFEMTYDGGGLRAYADTPADLVGTLIGGYRDLESPVRRAQARLVHATSVQVSVQATLNSDRGLDGCTDDEVRLLQGPRHEPPTPTVWRGPVPLILVTGFYRPHGPRPAPTAQPPGELWWIDAIDDLTLLASLHRLGMIDLAAAGPPPDGEGL